MTIQLQPTIGWTLSDPLNYTNWMAIEMVPANGTFNQSKREEQAVMLPIGRSNVVIISDVMRGWHFELHMEMEESDYNTFTYFRSLQRTLLLRSIWTSEQWYVRLAEVLEVAKFNTSPVLYNLHIAAEEQDPPD